MRYKMHAVVLLQLKKLSFLVLTESPVINNPLISHLCLAEGREQIGLVHWGKPKQAPPSLYNVCAVCISLSSCIYDEDRFETRTILKPSDGFKSVRTALKPSRPINTAFNCLDRFETSTLHLSTTPTACSRLPCWSRHIM